MSYLVIFLTPLVIVLVCEAIEEARHARRMKEIWRRNVDLIETYSKPQPQRLLGWDHKSATDQGSESHL
jgi:hypothetical protein